MLPQLIFAPCGVFALMVAAVTFLFSPSPLRYVSIAIVISAAIQAYWTLSLYSMYEELKKPPVKSKQFTNEA